jgi:hypothetical protein
MTFSPQGYAEDDQEYENSGKKTLEQTMSIDSLGCQG